MYPRFEGSVLKKSLNKTRLNQPSSIFRASSCQTRRNTAPSLFRKPDGGPFLDVTEGLVLDPCRGGFCGEIAGPRKQFIARFGWRFRVKSGA